MPRIKNKFQNPQGDHIISLRNMTYFNVNISQFIEFSSDITEHTLKKKHMRVHFSVLVTDRHDGQKQIKVRHYGPDLTIRMWNDALTFIFYQLWFCKSNASLFLDSIQYADKNLRSIENVLNHDLKILGKRSDEWLLKFKQKKIKVVFFDK